MELFIKKHICSLFGQKIDQMGIAEQCHKDYQKLPYSIGKTSSSTLKTKI